MRRRGEGARPEDKKASTASNTYRIGGWCISVLAPHIHSKPWLLQLSSPRTKLSSFPQALKRTRNTERESGMKGAYCAQGLPSPGRILLGDRGRWLRGLFWKMKVPAVDARSHRHPLSHTIMCLLCMCRIEHRFAAPCIYFGTREA